MALGFRYDLGRTHDGLSLQVRNLRPQLLALGFQLGPQLRRLPALHLGVGENSPGFVFGNGTRRSAAPPRGYRVGGARAVEYSGQPLT